MIGEHSVYCRRVANDPEEIIHFREEVQDVLDAVSTPFHLVVGTATALISNASKVDYLAPYARLHCELIVLI